MSAPGECQAASVTPASPRPPERAAPYLTEVFSLDPQGCAQLFGLLRVCLQWEKRKPWIPRPTRHAELPLKRYTLWVLNPQ